MNTLCLACVLFLTILLLVTFFASSLKLFFTVDELTEMGVRIEPSNTHEQSSCLTCGSHAAA